MCMKHFPQITMYTMNNYLSNKEKKNQNSNLDAKNAS